MANGRMMVEIREVSDLSSILASPGHPDYYRVVCPRKFRRLTAEDALV